MQHGFDNLQGLRESPAQQAIGLTATASDYCFQGKFKEIVDFLEDEENKNKKVTCTSPDSYLVVDIYDIAASAAEEIQKAVIGAIGGAVALLGQALDILKDADVKIMLRHGTTAQPKQSNHIGFKIKTENITFGLLAKAISYAMAKLKKDDADYKFATIEQSNGIVDFWMNLKDAVEAGVEIVQAVVASVDISDSKLKSNDHEDDVTALIKEKLDDGVFDDVINDKLADVVKEVAQIIVQDSLPDIKKSLRSEIKESLRSEGNGREIAVARNKPHWV